jgi:predicted ATPase/signal transduction histidine kinase/ActR/RegA family two-component response regulator
VISIPGYHIKEVILKNSSTTLLRAERLSDSEPVLLKQQNGRESISQVTKTEVHVRSCFESAWVLKILDKVDTENFELLELEDFGNAISMEQFLQTTFPTLEDRMKIAAQLTSVVEALHRCRILHRDIRPCNFLIDPETLTVKLCDLSMAHQFGTAAEKIDPAQKSTAALAYISPEQSGRTTMCEDHRSDLYSLGVMLYRLFTGRLPFEQMDINELVHAHIAKQPIQPNVHNETLPEALSEIIIKLLQKKSEDRYQSAGGLKADIKECCHQYRIHQVVHSFKQTCDELNDNFQLPSFLYGRDTEVEKIVSAYKRIGQGCEFIFLYGSSGMGKSALVNELLRQLNRRKDIIVMSAKCGQNNRTIPYGVFLKAFEGLTTLHKRMEVDSLNAWRDSMLKALGDSAGVLTDVIPFIESIIGRTTPADEYHALEGHKRVRHALINFLKAVTNNGTPVVLSVDDLQWADPASLELIDLIQNSVDVKNLLVIGTYRDSEKLVAHLQVDQKTNCQSIHLLPLNVDQVSELLGDAFGKNKEATHTLADHLVKCTLGNPLFITEALYDLYRNNLICFNAEHKTWDWHLDRILQYPGLSSSLQLITEKIQRLSKTTQQTILYAACIGQQFDLSMLAALLDKPDHETAEELNEAMRENLVVVLPASTPQKTNALPKKRYRFFHDEVQQAACTLMPGKERQEIHLSIGYFLLERLQQDDIENHIFEIVNHLNSGRDFISDDSEKRRLASLNLRAAKRAKKTAAYAVAHNYFESGLSLLDNTSWAKDYDLCLSLYAGGAEAAYLNDNFEASEALAHSALAAAKSIHDTIRIHQIRIQSLIFRDQRNEAVLLAATILRTLGVNFPPAHSTLDFLLAFLRTKWVLRKKRIDKLDALPKMKDPNALAAMELMQSITASAYHAFPKLYPLIVLKMVRLSARYGNAKESSLAYATYGVIRNAVETNNEVCYQHGEVATRLLDQFDDVGVRERTLLIYNLINRLSREHLHGSLANLKHCFKKGLQFGDLEYSAYASNAYCMLLCLSGKNLSWAKDEMLRCNTVPVLLQEKRKSNDNEALIQFIANLQNESEDPVTLNGIYFNESIGFPKILRDQQPSKLFTCYVLKMKLCLLMEDYTGGITNLAQAKALLNTSRGMTLEPVFYFYAALLSFALFGQSKTLKLKQQAIYYQRKLKRWAEQVPVNYMHRYCLTEAEHARVTGSKDRAIELYDTAIRLAQENNYLQDEALGNELAAKCWIERGQGQASRVYLASAVSAYKKWGCLLKVEQLKKYTGTTSREADIATRSEEADVLNNAVAPSLDLATILKASIALSSEVVFDRLLEKLMKFVIENAGAQSGYFILDWGGKLFIEARQSVTDERCIKLQIPLIHFEHVPKTIAEYVFESKKDVVLVDAQIDNPFSQDPAIIKNKVRSVLCIPALNQGKLVGALYLENNLTTGAFTKDRVDLLKLLSGQIAVSIENSILYENLEKKVQERTVEIQCQKQEIERQKNLVEEKSRFKEQFFANMSHEIRTPMTAIIGMSELIFDTPLSGKQLEYAKGIKYSSENLLAIINDILDYSKIEAGKFSFVNKPFQVRDRIKRLAYIVRLLAEEKGISYSDEVQPSIPDQLIGDPLRLHQILLNLVSNAIKFTEQGSVSISVAQVDANQDSVVLSFTVRDTGIGIAEEKLNFIFETFSRVEDEHSAQHTGTGLGLFIAKKLVEEQGGVMTVTSKVKLGTTFQFTLPFQRSTRIIPEETMDEIELTGTRILLVEDTLFNQIVAEEIIKKIINNPTVILAENGKVALEKLDAHTVDIILMDIKMPVMDGYAASREIRLRPDTASIPILAFTSNANPGEAEKCVAAGMNDYITKPIESKNLKSKIARLVQQPQLRTV